MLADVKYIKMQASLRKQLYIKNEMIIFYSFLFFLEMYESRCTRIVNHDVVN